jgi:hypothetical protein
MGNISKVGEICQSTYNLNEADVIMCFTVPDVPFSAFFYFYARQLENEARSWKQH